MESARSLLPGTPVRSRAARLGATTLALCALYGVAASQLSTGPGVSGAPPSAGIQGLSGPQPGFTLFAPLRDTNTYLIDNDGTVVHTWPSSYIPGLMAYMGDNGNLFRTIYTAGTAGPGAGGTGGGVQEVAWDGTLLWDYRYDDATNIAHHDIEVMPNGNVLLIAWRTFTQAEAIGMGKDPSMTTAANFYPDHIIEVQKTGPTTGNIVWQWNAWDHLVQDFDATMPNFGVVADHSELIDINWPPGDSTTGDWLHANGVDYNEALDQIMVSVHRFDEVWVIDHSTTTAEAAGHTGGDRGIGGDLLYRWGNPQTYRAGTAADKQFFDQHDSNWVTEGYPGAGNITVFSNGRTRIPQYSSIDEIEPPIDASGNYARPPSGVPFGPASLKWTYTATPARDLFCEFISGAVRLKNGNTLICCGREARFFEVDKQSRVVWEYINNFPLPGFGGTFKVDRYERYLWSNAESISASAPATVTLDITTGPSNASQGYVIAGGLSGTSPGTPLSGGVSVPINFDLFTGTVLANLNGPVFVNFLGTLDSAGDGQAQLVIPAALGPAAVGLTAHFAFAFTPGFDFVSNAVSLRIDP